MTPALSCTGLTYSFGTAKAVDGLDLLVRPGEVFGLLGPNGAGKTTTMRAITTLLPVPSGVIEVFGHDAARQKMAVRRLLGYVPQQLSADSRPHRPGERRPLRPRLRRAPPPARGPRRTGAGRGRPRPPGAPARRHVLRRHGAPPRTGPGPGQRTPPDDPGRTDHRPGPDRARQRLGPHHRDPDRHRDDRAGHPPTPWTRPISAATGWPSCTSAGSARSARPPSSRPN